MKDISSKNVPFGGSKTAERQARPSSPRPPDTVRDKGGGAEPPAADAPERRVRLLRGDEGASAGPAQDDRSLGRRLHVELLFAFNFVVAALGLVLLSPLMLLIAIAVKLDSRGPVIFRQLRVGRDRRRDESEGNDRQDGHRSEDLGGRPFFIYKFRTMKVNAERETGPVWASSDDDRCTRVGRVLRRYRLDELPQLWNVIRGEMSIVGPRPERPGYVKILRREIDEYRDRQKIRPGITGWAQIHQEGDSSVEDVRRKVHYDIQYLRDRSFKFDLEIMLRTPVVMMGRADRHETGKGTDRRAGSR